MGTPEQFLPFPPETNLLPVYLLSFAVIWNGLYNLHRIAVDKIEESGPAPEGGKR